MSSNCVLVIVNGEIEYCPIRTTWVGEYHTLLVEGWIESMNEWTVIKCTKDTSHEHNNGRRVFEII